MPPSPGLPLGRDKQDGSMTDMIDTIFREIKRYPGVILTFVYHNLTWFLKNIDSFESPTYLIRTISLAGKRPRSRNVNAELKDMGCAILVLYHLSVIDDDSYPFNQAKDAGLINAYISYFTQKTYPFEIFKARFRDYIEVQRQDIDWNLAGLRESWLQVTPSHDYDYYFDSRDIDYSEDYE